LSESSEKGKDLEKQIASILRKKLGARVERDKRSGAGWNKSDISDWYREIPLFIEAKNQKTIKIKEFFKQAEQGASIGQAPTVVFNVDDEELLACLRFEDLVNFLVEIRDYKDEIESLREPIIVGVDIAKGKDKTVQTSTCRNGHLSDEYGYCQILDCKFSRGYRASKKKK
jgi:hypothetical protein